MTRGRALISSPQNPSSPASVGRLRRMAARFGIRRGPRPPVPVPSDDVPAGRQASPQALPLRRRIDLHTAPRTDAASDDDGAGTDDPGGLLDPRAEAEAREAAAVAVAPRPGPPGWRMHEPDVHLLGTFHWFRCELLDGPDADGELARACAYFTLLFQDHPGSVPPPVLASLRAAVAGVPASDLSNGPAFWRRCAAAPVRAAGNGTGTGGALAGALVLIRLAVAATAPGDPEHGRGLGLLVRALRTDPGWAADPETSAEILDAARRAVAAFPAGDAEGLLHRAVLSTVLTSLWEATGDPDHLAEALRTSATATADSGVAPPSAVHRIPLLTATALALHARYSAEDSLADLRAALAQETEAVRLAEAEEPALLPGLLPVRAVSLVDLYSRTRDDAHIGQAIDDHRRALALLDPSGSDHAETSFLLAAAHTLRHRHRREPEDLAAARRLVGALRRTPGHARRLGVRLIELEALLLRQQGESERDEAVLRRGERAQARALRKLVASGVPERDLIRPLTAHAGVLGALHTLTGGRTDLEQAAALYERAAGITAAPPFDRVLAALGAGRAQAALNRPDRALPRFRAALELLPAAAWHGLPRTDREHILSALAGIGGEAAAAALDTGDPDLALELLEQGRGVLLRQALDRRAERRRLRVHRPQLLARLDRARQALDRPEDGVTGIDDPSAFEPDPRRAAEREWDALVRTVRQETGLPFLTGPHTAELLRAGAEGPVVIVNCARTRSDALIVLPGGITVVPLPGLSPEYAGELARGLDRAAALAEDDPAAAHPLVDDVLAELGTRVAAPVLGALDSLPGIGQAGATAGSLAHRLPRLWWCPTGQAAFLPLHAARLPDGTWLPDRWVSSYTVTLRTLVESRASGAAATADEPAAPERQAAPPLIVCVPRPGEQDRLLRHADDEARRVLAHLPGAELLPGDGATPQAVLAALRTSRWLHFIGHAEQVPSAEGGALLRCRDTGDGREGAVTAAEIADLGAAEADLAYLSACETAIGDIDLPDEAAHLAGALQMAGFRHVIAAQWAVSDRRAPDLADAFYGRITDAEGPHADGSARALHHVVTTLRRARPDAAALWAPYVHVGP
ncbi:CHAT domain-containing protein [Streptomyces sp. NPDC005811]|uniref:CHAT domain-containing protein n=1 Tax=Streptomyces sp. NPDC005811 TaxID=3154565 RepID=UPI0033FCF868